ncbi:MAG: hypothetical protein JXR25_02715 [Pontiellaceae bacterium]|nr:hypothetical protein [Pontiellaceae bacterium]MBN2783715.1 hypothetical protein [Pontiellaceae bacterium]
MKNRALKIVSISIAMWGCVVAVPANTVELTGDGALKGIYVGDDLYPPSDVTAEARASGFNTVFLFALHVYPNGDLYFNDKRVVVDGIYVGDPDWGRLLSSLRPAVNRIEMAIGGWGDLSFDTIRSFVDSNGTAPGSVLYDNFLALKNATGVDAIQYDDEHVYDTDSAVAFGEMLAGMGLKVTLCPYTARSFWSSVKAQLGATVDAVYLQCYDGGAYNNPADWNAAFGGLKVYPGLWGNTSSAPEVTAKMRYWQETLGITGGFMWLNGGLPFDALKWGQALAFGLDPLNGLIAEDSAVNYAAEGYTGNQGFGYEPWVIDTPGGGSYASGGDNPQFGIWNSAINGTSVASRSFREPLESGQSLFIQLRFNSLDGSGNTNAFQLADSLGNVLFSYYHVGGDVNDGHYKDATGTHAAIGFAYNYSQMNDFVFTLNSASTYTFKDITTGAQISGSMPDGAIRRVTFLRANGRSGTSSNGNDFNFNGPVIYSPENLAAAFTTVDSGVKIRFSVTPCLSYRIQRTSDLNEAWDDVENVKATFYAVEFTDSDPTGDQAFYRITAP